MPKRAIVKLRVDVDTIVQRYGYPVVPNPEAPAFARLKTRLRDTARTRAKLLRQAAAAVVATRDERGAVRVHPDSPSGHASLGALFVTGCLIDGRNGDAVLTSLANDLSAAASIFEEMFRPTRRGRRADAWVQVLVRDVALLCLDHDIRFTDNPRGAAADVLRKVFTRVAAAGGAWVGASRTDEGWRPLLRTAQMVQEHVRRSE